MLQPKLLLSRRKSEGAKFDVSVKAARSTNKLLTILKVSRAVGQKQH